MVTIHRDEYTVLVAKRWKYLSVGLAAVLVVECLLRHSFGMSSSQCAVSFGRFRGHEYIEASMTAGKPKCLVESKWMKLQQHSVRLPGTSSLINDWLWIDYHDRINVLVEDEKPPGTQERRFLIFEQSKYALEGRSSLAVVGGIIEPGEDAQVAARREVSEEMGLECTDFHSLGRFRTDVNRGMGWVHSFLATHCSRTKPMTKKKSEVKVNVGTSTKNEEIGPADTEHQDLKSITLRQLRDAATSSQFLEVQWSNTVALALLHPELMV